MTEPLILWHGAQRWEGPPRLHVASGKSQEHGPGLYLTTSAETARKYARGGGSVIRFEVEPELQLLQSVKVQLAKLEAFVRELPRLKARKEILADLKRYAERVGKTEIPASVLVNLMVNYRAIAGESGLALSRFLVAQGVDADLISHGSEDWLLLFNLDKIRSWKKVPAGQAVDSPRLRRNPSSPTAPSAAQGLRLGLEHHVDWDRVAFTPEQLAVGAHHELEHTRSLISAAKIALDHLRERPDYYTRLDECMPERKRNSSALVRALQQLRPQLAEAANRVLADWQQDEEGVDEEFGTGGACDAISRAMGSVLAGALPEEVDIEEGGQEGDDHAYLLVLDAHEMVVVDIPPGVYETGAGYRWRKRAGVVLQPEDVVIESLGSRVTNPSSSLSFAGREPLTGADVKKAFADNAAYKLLDKTPAAGSTWTAGGCWLLADALHALGDGGGDLWVVVDAQGAPQHVVVKYGDTYWDADGASSEAVILRRARAEGTRAPKLVRFTGDLQRQAERAGIPAPTNTTMHAIIEYLRAYAERLRGRERGVGAARRLGQDLAAAMRAQGVSRERNAARMARPAGVDPWHPRAHVLYAKQGGRYTQVGTVTQAHDKKGDWIVELTQPVPRGARVVVRPHSVAGSKEPFEVDVTDELQVRGAR